MVLHSEAEHFVNFNEQQNKFCSGYTTMERDNGSKKFLLVDGVKIYQFKQKIFQNKYIFYKFEYYFKILYS